MSYLDVYIGDPKQTNAVYKNTDDEAWRIGNVPKRISPFFPDGHRAFYLLINQIEDGYYEGKKIDWGAWAAKVSKEKIKEFII
jgi:hypothetical protein